MWKIISITSLLSLYTNIVLSDNVVPINDPHSAENFMAWQASKPDFADVIFIAENSFTCMDRDRFINVYNAIRDRGGQYTHRYFKNLPCYVFDGWSYGRIIETTDNSDVVKVQYQRPMTQSVSKGWFHIEALDTLKNHLANQAR